MILALVVFLFSAHGADLFVEREQARGIMKQVSCGGCHTPGLTTTNVRALKVYNLNETYWTSTLNDRQLGGVRFRLSSGMTPEERREMRVTSGHPEPTLEQKKILLAFIDKEIANRRKEPLDRFRHLQKSKNPEFFKLFPKGN